MKSVPVVVAALLFADSAAAETLLDRQGLAELRRYFPQIAAASSGYDGTLLDRSPPAGVGAMLDAGWGFGGTGAAGGEAAALSGSESGAYVWRALPVGESTAFVPFVSWTAAAGGVDGRASAAVVHQMGRDLTLALDPQYTLSTWSGGSDGPERVPRRDHSLGLTSGLRWSAMPGVAVSASVGYAQKWTLVGADEYRTFIVAPTFRVLVRL
ncbi:MAG: hypothetical protein HQL41_18545 [Alphaproteobacteria bacterium]|nr:hypothetical protein [Alphaproteobacteria bacterium]